jgi:hypothetical protein
VPELPGVLDGQMFADLPVGGVALPPVLPNALRPPAVSPPIAGRGGADPVEHAAPARLVIVRPGAIDFVSAGVVVHLSGAKSQPWPMTSGFRLLPRTG